MDADLYERVENYILRYWLEHGYQPSVLEVANEFMLTVDEIEPLVESYEDDDD